VKRVSPIETGAHTTRTVERACSVLSAFSAEEPRLSLGDLATRVGLPKATVHRLAGSLVAMGFMEHGEDGGYSLGLKVSELGAVARANLDLVTACSSALDALAADTEETVLLAAADWEALDLTIVDARVSPQTLLVVPFPGERMPMPPGALCKALLLGLPAGQAERVLDRLALPSLTDQSQTDRGELSAEIEAARSLGYAVGLDEYVDGASGVAVPVLFDRGWPRAAIAVVGPTSRIAEETERIGRRALELTAALRPPGIPPERVAA
jgi:DNA-binding IclR family transcriptional regulator